MANQFLSLALFLMLLSFFIVMNAVSSFERDKTSPVMDSLALAFSNRVIERKMAPFDDPSARSSVDMGDTLEELEGLFNAHIAGFEASRNRLGTVMHVRTSVGQFENAIDMVDVDYNNDAIGTKGSFAQTLVTLMRSKERGKSYRMDMLLNIPKEPASFENEQPEEFVASLKRVSSFATSLEAVGMPKKMLSVGLIKGDDGFIDLYFYRYKPFNIYEKIKASAKE